MAGKRLDRKCHQPRTPSNSLQLLTANSPNVPVLIWAIVDSGCTLSADRRLVEGLPESKGTEMTIAIALRGSDGRSRLV